MQLNTVMAAQLVQAFVFGEDLQDFKNLGLCGQCILTFRGWVVHRVSECFWRWNHPPLFRHSIFAVRLYYKCAHYWSG
jgi:hypothetical protein